EDFTEKFDLLRCNPDFQVNHNDRFDCVNINMDNDPLAFGRLLYLLSVRLPSGKDEDVALVRMFKRSSFKPRTIWENCRILEDGKTMFVLPQYFVRGAHFINAFGAPGLKVETTFYLNDVVDFDWFLR
ncbi:hypothetical protein DFH09DRAFT_886917, partial [Mycena vulgaris]